MISKLLYRVFPFMATCIYAADFILHGNIFIIAGFVLILPYLCRYSKILLKSRILTTFVFLVFIGSILNLLTTQNGIGGTINFITCVGIALFCVNNSRVTGILSAFICLGLLYYVYSAMFINGIGANYIFESKGMSRNYPGFMAVIFVSYWGYTKYLNYNSYPLLLPLIALVLCFFLEGRASLGVMAMISLVCLFYRGKNYIFIFLLVSIAGVLYYWKDILDLFYLSRFAEAGLESARSIIWKTYFQSLNIPSFLFGLDTLSVPVLREYGGNPHNAFLNFHYRMGLLGLVALLILIINSLKMLFGQKQYILCCYILLLLVRCFFDSCIGGASDFMLYAMLFYPIVKSQGQINISHRKKFLSSIIEII